MSADDGSESAESQLGLGDDSADSISVEAYKALGMVDDPDTIVSDEQVSEGFRRVERADGTIERHYTDSIWIIALDGTTTTWRPDETATVFHPDGSRTEVDATGARHSVRNDGSPLDPPSNTTTEPDGTIRQELASGAVLVAELDGSRSLLLPDGTRSVTRTDGTVERISEKSTWESGVDGTTVITRSDGTQSIVHSDGSRTDRDAAGGVVEIDSGERQALSDEVVVEEAPERAEWVRLVVPGAVVVGVIVVLVLLLTTGGDDPDTSFVVPDAARAMQDAPDSFDLEAWCKDVNAALDAQIVLDGQLASRGRGVEAAVDLRSEAVETAASGAPPDLVEEWQKAVAGSALDAAALQAAEFDLDTYVRDQPADVVVPGGPLDDFLVEQVDSCVAAVIGS